MYRRHNFEERLKIISRLEAGESLRSLCKEFKIDDHEVSQWYFRYKKYGDAGLRRKVNKSLSPAEKETAVRLHEEKGLSLQNVCNEFDINRHSLKSWIRQVRTNGYASLYEPGRRGRPPKDPMARQKKKEPQTELEKLQAENLRLRAENALLKKVKALVEEQEARARLNGQKPSTN